MPNPSLSTTKQILTLLSIALLVFVFDQLTKIWIVNHYVKNPVENSQYYENKKHFVLAFKFMFCLEDNRKTNVYVFLS